GGGGRGGGGGGGEAGRAPRPRPEGAERAPPQQLVARVDLLGVGFPRGGLGAAGGLAVDGRGHEEPVQRLEPPAVADQLGGQPVEEFRVRRAGAGGAAGGRRRRDPPPEVVLTG